jgi:hypothetical protein
MITRVIRERLVHNEGNAATGGIWRVRESGRSEVLKVACPPSDVPRGRPAWQTSAEPSHWNYWRREVLAYTTGLAATAYAKAGIVAPELLRVLERSDGSVALSLADATGTPGTRWSVDRLAHFARQLGHAQAEWAGRVPDLPWLSRRWLAQYQAGRHVWVRTDIDWDHPGAAVWPAPVREVLARMMPAREKLLKRAESSPRTLCHLDVWPMNLIEAADTTVLLDWAFVGEGGIGEDLANLIVDSVADGLMDAALLPEINERTTDAYLDGLREGGYLGTSDKVREAVAANGAAKYAWFGAAVLGKALSNEAYGHPQYGQHASGAEALRSLRGLVTLLADWAAPDLRR